MEQPDVTGTVLHDGELPDGVAEAFIYWAKGEGLSFWKS